MNFKNKSNNPFNGLKNCLRILGATELNNKLLDAAYTEVKDNSEKLKMFYSLMFAIGDITNREHNIFKGNKVDGGGYSERRKFYQFVDWLKRTDKDQFVKFLNAGLFNEYQCFDTLFRNRVQTRNGKVINVYNAFDDEWYREVLSDYICTIVKGNNPFNKHLVAKFLTIPRLSKRKGHAKLLPETKLIMRSKESFLILLSKKLGWQHDYRNGYVNFQGYKDWRKQYNGNLESVLFSTKKILEFGKQEFIEWFDKLPALARQRVISRISDIEKWPNLYSWYREWDKFKTQKQVELRKLKEKARQGEEIDADELAQLEKEAKVNVGANTFEQLYKDICNDTIDKLKLEAFIDKVNLPYNTLVIMDDSGSMLGAPFNFAKFIASVCLYKNPDDDGRNLLGFFNSQSHWHSCIDRKLVSPVNSWMRRNTKRISPMPFVNPELSFYDNYKQIADFCESVFESGCTHIDSIPDSLHSFCEQNPEVLDSLKAYPIWTILSDGEWNNLRSPQESMKEFMNKCQNYFGFKPFIIAIDICNYDCLDPTRFIGVDNMIYIPSNPAQIEQFLTNFKNSDSLNVYSPLLALYRSNRYELVRQLI